MSLGRAMVGGAKLVDGKSQRPVNDFYRTPPEAVIAFMLHEAAQLDYLNDLWEPCCGDGAIARLLSNRGNQVVGTDLDPRGYGTALNFLEADRLLAPAIVTNPPYKKDLPALMLKHALGLGAVYIVFLLKATYWNSKRGLRLFRQHPPKCVLGLSWRLDFQDLGRPTMDTCWNVWDLSYDGPTTYDILPKPALTVSQQLAMEI